MDTNLLHFDSLALVSLVTFSLLVLITLAMAGRTDLAGTNKRDLALVVVGTLLAYSTGSVWLFVLGWVLSSLPLILPSSSADAKDRRLPALVAICSALALTAGMILLTGFKGETERTAGFLALVLAVMLRKGIFPMHFWVSRAFETTPLPIISLILNGHLGAYLLLRFAVPMDPEMAAQALPALSFLAIATAIIAALIALVKQRPRDILAMLCVSQASFLLAGLENRNIEGITGALVHWWVVAFSTTALILVYRALEVRTAEAAETSGFLGLGFHAPRLAFFFLVAALALVGLPGTLGFAAEDLLFHGSLESHPLLGIGLPIATALNAITILRLFARLFLGKRGINVAPIPDALPKERMAMSLPVVLLVVAGLAPAIVVSLRLPAAENLVHLLGGR